MQTHLFLLFGVGAAAQQACTQHASAKTGDTCATLAKAHGIDQTQFISLNPGLRSCALVAGTSYCVGDETTTASSGSGSDSNSSTELTPSPDGSDGVCGGTYTCLGSVYGDCCSLAGYCGNATDYCVEDNCDPRFGRCGVIAGEGEGGTVETVTVTATVVSASVSTATVTVTPTSTPAPAGNAGNSGSPTPTLPGTTAECVEFAQIGQVDTCANIEEQYDITQAELYEWNPSIACNNLRRMAGYYICVAV